MKCKNAINQFMLLDDYKNLPWRIKFHILFCKNCRQEIRKLTEELNSLTCKTPFYITRDISDDVMNIINNFRTVQQKNMSNFKWIAAGAIMLSSMFLVSFSNSMIWLKSTFGSSFIIPLSIVQGLVITGYAALFIGSHLDGLKKTFFKNVN